MDPFITQLLSFSKPESGVPCLSLTIEEAVSLNNSSHDLHIYVHFAHVLQLRITSDVLLSNYEALCHMPSCNLSIARLVCLLLQSLKTTLSIKSWSWVPLSWVAFLPCMVSNFLFQCPYTQSLPGDFQFVLFSIAFTFIHLFRNLY